MVFDLLECFESLAWVFLNALINKICCFLGVVIPRVFLVNLNLDLLGEDLVSDLILSLPFVGPFTSHAFISNHPESKKVSIERMVSHQHYFWCHVPRSSRLDVMVVLTRAINLFSYPEIGQVQITFIVKNQIFWFEITVNYVLLMTSIESHGDAGNKELSTFWLKGSLLNEVKSEVTTREQIYGQVQVVFILECVVSVDNELRIPLRLINLPQKIQLFDNARNGIF